jgi:HD-GYP domain-containing protein (c-di-GMP phosphodiesterase class II)
MKRSLLERISFYLEFPFVSFILLASIAITLAMVIQQQFGNQVLLLLGEDFTARIRLIIWGGVGLSFIFIYIYILMLFRITSRELVRKSQENSKLLENTEKQLSELTSMEDELKRNYQMQNLLSSMLQVSLKSLTLDQQLDEILDQIVSIPWLKINFKGCIYLFDEKENTLIINAYTGLSESLVSSNRSNENGHCLCGKVIGSGKIGFFEKEELKHYVKTGKHSFDVHYYLPIKHGDNLLGVLNLLMSGTQQIIDKDDEFFKAVTDVLAGIIEQKRTEDKLNKSVSILRTALGGTIHAMALTVETRDPYTAGHQRRVSNLARAIATEMGLSKDQIEGVRIAGIVHDLGKISIPTEILSKPGGISSIEHSLINTHPQAGFDILNSISFPWPIAQIVLQHHERLDGSGYPAGLKKDEILIEAKIISVADVVEAMASHRPYRPSRGIQLALEEITNNKNILYDPKVVDACLRLFLNKGFQFDRPLINDGYSGEE